MDDVGGITDRGGYVFVQAKLGLRLSRAVGSPLREAIDQAVRQFLAGAPAGSDGSRRGLEPGRDVLVICTDAQASSQIRNHLRTVLERLASLPDGMPLTDAARNASERAAVEVLLFHLRASFTRHGQPWGEGQIHSVGRLLRITSLDLGPDGGDRAIAESHLRSVLDDPNTAPGAWNDLLALAQRISAERQWVDRDGIRDTLSRGGHPAGIDPPFRSDVQVLRDATRSVLELPPEETSIPAPERAVTIRRESMDLLSDTDGSFVLIGDPGIGKTFVATAIAARLVSAGEDVVFLGAESLAGTLGQTRTELAMQNNLDNVLRGWDGSGRATLIVDGVDATRGTSSIDWIPQLIRSIRGTRWRVVATIRTFDLRYGPEWQRAFAGQPIDDSLADKTFSNVRHARIDDLNDDELSQIHNQSPQLASLIASAGPPLLGLLRNPFNLRLVAQLIEDLSIDDVVLTGVRTRQELLRLYWQRRVEIGPSRMLRRRAISDLAESMVRNRRARIGDPSSAVDPSLLDTVDALLRDGVLREDVQGRASGSPVIFSHPVLYDYTVAVTFLQREDGLHVARCLDDDPDLAITIRPSIDMFLADLWTADASRHPFWNLATALCSPAHDHAIAAIAAGCAVIRQRPTHEDLEPIEARAAAADENGRAARRCIAHLAGALGSADVSATDREAAAPALGQLAAVLAARASARDEIDLADLSGYLLFRLARLFPLGAGSVAADSRSRAAADLMRFALSHPADPMREKLAVGIAEDLARATAINPEDFGPIIEEASSMPIMTVWGGAVAYRLISQLSSLAQAAPQIAEHLALSVWEFDEHRHDSTAVGNSNILALSSTRAQDLEIARYNTGQAFAAFLDAAPEAAQSFFLAIVEKHAGPQEVRRTNDQLPRIYGAPKLEYAPGLGCLRPMADAFVSYLLASARSGNPVAETVTAQLVAATAAKLTHPEVWNRLLDAGASNPGSLGRKLLPLLEASDLLGHHLTSPSAARLAATLSPILSEQEHAILERAVLGARDPLDPSAERTQALVDLLLDQLTPEYVRTAAAKERLAELTRRGAPAQLPDAVPPTSESPWAAGPASPEDDGELGLAAVKRLHHDFIGTMSGSAEEQVAARDSLRQSVPAAFSALRQAATSSDQSLSREVLTLLVNAAERLASDPLVLPETELGETVLEILQMGLPSADEGGCGGVQ